MATQGEGVRMDNGVRADDQSQKLIKIGKKANATKDSSFCCDSRGVECKDYTTWLF